MNDEAIKKEFKCKCGLVIEYIEEKEDIIVITCGKCGEEYVI